MSETHTDPGGSTAMPRPDDASNTGRRGLSVLVGGAVTGIDRMPMLNIVVDRLARLLTTSLRNFTADNADVTIERTRALRLKDFLDAQGDPALIAVVHAEQWDSYCLIAPDARLIGSIVDVLLGGRRNSEAAITGRPYTQIERTFVDRLVDVIIRDLQRAFEQVCEVEFVLDRFEATPSYAAITKLTAAAITFRAEINLEGRGGHIDFLIPYAALETVRDVLTQEFVGKKQSEDVTWRNHLMAEIPHTTVQLRCVVESRAVPAGIVAGWAIGSSLVLDRRHDELVELYCDQLLVLRGRIAERNGRVALQVEERLIAEDWPT